MTAAGKKGPPTDETNLAGPEPPDTKNPWEFLAWARQVKLGPDGISGVGLAGVQHFTAGFTLLISFTESAMERDALIKDGAEVFGYQVQTMRTEVRRLYKEKKTSERAIALTETPESWQRRVEEARQQAQSVLAHDDPLVLVEQALRQLGYGGNTDPALIVYLAMTSRLLVMRHGTMPCHLLLIGVPGAGKSYTLQVNLRLMPPEAWYGIDAGSPRVLIYGPAALRHRVVVFSEADSLPSGEDNPAASALRSLLQDHYLHYAVVVRDKETGEYVVDEIIKPGPTQLVTTAIHRLAPQLDSRVFCLEVPEDRQRVKEALAMRARIEARGGVEEPDPDLIAFQLHLQGWAPWDVVVPFAPALSRMIGNSHAGPRILRDYERLMSLIKAVTLLRHRHRRQDETGRWVATLDDYRRIYELVGPMYEGTTGASKEVRQVVEAVEQLLLEKKRASPVLAVNPMLEERVGVSGAEVARRLEIYTMAASRRIKVALHNGWLINRGAGKRQALVPGDALPELDGLPTPESLSTTRTPMGGPPAGVGP